MQGSRCIRNIMVPCNMGPQGSDSDIPLSVSYQYHSHVSGHVYILGGGDRVSYVGNPGNSASGRSEGMLADIRALLLGFKDNSCVHGCPFRCPFTRGCSGYLEKKSKSEHWESG